MIKTTKDGREISSEEFRSMWSAELRSGKYVQGKGILHNVTTGGMCCLGVGCALYQELFGDLEVTDLGVMENPPPWIKPEFKGQNVRYYDGCPTILPKKVAMALDITTHGAFKQAAVDGLSDYSFLTSLNDKEDKTFSEIADVIDQDTLLAYGNIY